MDTQEFHSKQQSPRLIILQAGQVQQINLEDKPQWLLGRTCPQHTSADIAVPSPIVSRQHGWFRKENGVWFYCDNQKNLNGTYYNGQFLPRSYNDKATAVALHDGDTLRVDAQDLNHPSPDGVLILFTTDCAWGNWAACVLPEDGTVTIGRDPACEICETSDFVSQKHAVITCKNGVYTVEDCGSSCGTKLNNVTVDGAVTLWDKDRISIGNRNYFLMGSLLIYVKAEKD